MSRIKKCVVPGCMSSSINENFINFPKFGTENFYEWAKIIGRLDIQKKRNHICRKHFSTDCFRKSNGDGDSTRLRRGFKPTRLLNCKANDVSLKTYEPSKKRKLEISETVTSLSSDFLEKNEGDSYSANDGLEKNKKKVKTYYGPKTFRENLNIDDYDEFTLLNSSYMPSSSKYLFQDANFEYDNVIAVPNETEGGDCKDCEKYKRSLQLWKNKYIKLKLILKKKE